MSKSQEKIRAQSLRRKGKSIKNIAQILGVSRGSASVWCRDITLTQAQRNKLFEAQVKAGNHGRSIGALINKQKKRDAIAMQEQKAKEKLGTLSKRDLFMLGIGLYWGEGVKAEQSAVAFVNSDPEAVVFAQHWFSLLGVAKDRFNPRIFISEQHRTRKNDILSFWSRRLAIPKHQFANMVFLKGKPKKVYENHNSYYGVLSLGVRRGSALKYHILGLIKECKKPT